MSNSLTPRQVATQWFDRLWVERDESSVTEFMAPDGIAHLEGGAKTVGPGQFIEFYRSIIGTFPDFKLNVIEIVAEDDKVCVRWEAQGTHGGNAMGLPPTDRAHSFRGITWLHVRDGQIVEGGDVWNQGALLTQMAAV